MRKVLIVFFILFCFLSGEDKRTLLVTGEVNFEVKPDVVLLNILVEKDGLTAQEAQEFHKKLVNDVLAAIQQKQIESDRIKSDGYSLITIYPEEKKEKMIYRSSIRLSVELYQVSDLGPLVDAVMTAGATKIEKIIYALKDEQTAKKSALDLASADAKNKAAALAEQLNINLAAPINIEGKTELDSGNNQNNNKILIKAETKVTYEITPK